MDKSYRVYSLLFVLLLLSQVAVAQFTVRGTITDETSGEPLVGVNVFHQASQSGATTDLEGTFTLELPGQNATLRISYIGYISQNVEVSAENNEITIQLNPDIANLEEVVVTGLASTVKRSNLANSVSSISADDIAGKVDPPTLDNAMQGKIPGVQITSYSGAPGGGYNVQLRGVSTLGAGGSQPLYIIDGVYVNNEFLTTGRSTVSGAGGNSQDDTANRIADLNPDDIQSIEVLKGASAAAIYGQRANAGVVIINTKQGSAGQTQISVKQDVGFNSPLNLLGRTDWTEERIDIFYSSNPARAQLEKDRLNAARQAGDVVDLEEYIYGNEGLIRKTQVSISGGNEKTQYFVSGGLDSEDGIIRNTGFQRNTIRANLDHSISDNIKISSNSNYINTDSDRGFTGNQNNTGGSIGYSLAFHPNYAFNIIKEQPDGTYNDSPYFSENPLRLIDVAVNNQEVNRFLQSVNLEANLYRGTNSALNFTASGGLDYTNANSIIYFPEFMQFQRTAANFPGDANHTTQEVLNTNLQAVLLYNTTVGSNFGNFDLTSQAGLSRFDQNISLDRIRGQGLLPGQTNVGNAAEVTAAQNFTDITDFGIFAQQEINFEDQLIATLGGRWDKSTLNLNEANFYFYPKASLAVNISNFDFWELDNVSQFKLRAAYGETGGLPNFGAIFTSLGGTNVGPFGGATAPNTDVDPNLKPERAKEFEYGLDMAFFDGRVSFELTRYNKTIEDLILNLEPSPATGVAQIATNAAELENVGTEIGLSLVPVQNENFSWDSGILWWTNETELTNLIIPAQTNTFFASPAFGASRFEEGISPTGIYGFTPDGEQTIIGDLQPDFQMSFSNDFTFLNNFQASFLIHWSKGAEGINLSQLLTDSGGNSDDFFDSENNIVDREGGTLAFLKDASYVKVRQASLYYTFTNEALQPVFGDVLGNLRVGVTGTNLLMFTDYNGYDPEVNATGRSALSQRVDITPYPTSRKILFSVKVDF